MGKKAKILILVFLGLFLFMIYTIVFESNIFELYQKNIEYENRPKSACDGTNDKRDIACIMERSKTIDTDKEKCKDVMKNSWKYYPETIDKCKSLSP